MLFTGTAGRPPAKSPDSVTRKMACEPPAVPVVMSSDCSLTLNFQARYSSGLSPEIENRFHFDPKANYHASVLHVPRWNSVATGDHSGTRPNQGFIIRPRSGPGSGDYHGSSGDADFQRREGQTRCHRHRWLVSVR